jgi:hypothetical protein
MKKIDVERKIEKLKMDSIIKEANETDKNELRKLQKNYTDEYIKLLTQLDYCALELKDIIPEIKKFWSRTELIEIFFILFRIDVGHFAIWLITFPFKFIWFIITFPYKFIVFFIKLNERINNYEEVLEKRKSKFNEIFKT